MDIGARIKYLREIQGITVNKLANKSGISQSYLRDIELGNKNPTIEYLEYICYGLGIQLCDFFYQPEKKPSEIDIAISKLSVEQRRALVDFINSFVDKK